jgi:hypothetical protein
MRILCLGLDSAIAGRKIRTSGDLGVKMHWSAALRYGQVFLFYLVFVCNYKIIRAQTAGTGRENIETVDGLLKINKAPRSRDDETMFRVSLNNQNFDSLFGETYSYYTEPAIGSTKVRRIIMEDFIGDFRLSPL